MGTSGRAWSSTSTDQCHLIRLSKVFLSQFNSLSPNRGLFSSPIDAMVMDWMDRNSHSHNLSFINATTIQIEASQFSIELTKMRVGPSHLSQLNCEMRSTGFNVGGFKLPVSLKYTWTNEAEFKSAFDSGFAPWGEVEAGDALPYIPEHQLRLGAGLVSERFRMNLAASYIGELRTEAGQGPYDPKTSIESRIIWDAIARWNFTDNLSTYIKIDNLLDETYIASRRPSGVRPGLPRTAYLGLTFRL